MLHRASRFKCSEERWARGIRCAAKMKVVEDEKRQEERGRNLETGHVIPQVVAALEDHVRTPVAEELPIFPDFNIYLRDTQHRA